MEKIEVVKNADTTEEIYIDFARKASEHSDSKIVFSYDFLQFLIHLADYNEIDFDLSDIQYSDDEECIESKFILKSGMQLIFTRVRHNDDRSKYDLESLQFSFGDHKYTYSYPQDGEKIEIS